jgi:low affinity Fe/Cu permease
MGGRNGRSSITQKFERLSEAVTRRAGSTVAFVCALGVVILWAILGPIFQFSNTWQLVINTGTTIITFLMVFLIQRSQNKDSLAIHLKLNEIVAALEGASNRLIDVEALTEKDLQTLECHYGELAELARKDTDLAQSHSVEEARERHSNKRRPRRRAGYRGGRRGRGGSILSTAGFFLRVLRVLRGADNSDTRRISGWP